jgi:hypothetical protein
MTSQDLPPRGAGFDPTKSDSAKVAAALWD